MTLILMRHATRNFNDDDSLSSEGHRLATTLAQVLKNRGHVPTRLYCSPKQRTRQTLKPVSDTIVVKVEIDPRLDERDNQESVQEFENRIRQFLNAAREKAASDEKSPKLPRETWLACSHLDWLEAAVLDLASDENDFERAEPWAPMAIRIYNFEDGIWKRDQKQDQKQDLRKP